MCCGIDTDRYCCIPSSTTRSSLSASAIFTPNPLFDDFDSYSSPTSDSLLSEKWLFIQMCTIGIFLAIVLLIFVIIYLCLTSMKHPKNTSILQIPLPSAPSHFIEPKRHSSNRISTISSTSSDGKSRCTDTSIMLNTPLNHYPTGTSRNSTVSSSYYIYPNELEYLCK